jgi:hypothetical protein
MAAVSRWWQTRGFDEEVSEIVQQIAHEVGIGGHEHRGHWWCLGHLPQNPVPMPDEGHGAPAEVPQYRPQGFKPLNPEDHVVRPQRQSVAVYAEHLAADGD